MWVVEKALGSGGMGSVYRCHNRHAGKILAAIKTLEPSARTVPEAEQRFVREAEILFALDHPNVVKVRNVRLDIDVPYLEMEFVEGENLEARLCRGPVALPDAAHLARQLFDAVAYLHDQGIRHRDVKPANLVVNKEGVLKLVDFGLASDGDAERITRSNSTFGTVSYAPPEWVQPEVLDPELWDVYSCGVVFWEMLTARVAFPGSQHVDPRQVAIQIMTVKQGHPPLDPGEGFPDAIRELCKDMTQGNPKNRVPTMRDALERLGSIEGLPSPTLPDASGALPGASRRKATEGPKSAGPTAARKKTTKSAGRPEAPSSPGSGGVIVALGGVAAVVVFLGILVFGLGGVWLIAGGGEDEPVTPPPVTRRDVDVVVVGLQRGTEVALRVGDAKAASVDGFVHHFKDVPVGAAMVRWAVGTGCAVDGCPGPACPQWCIVGDATRPVDQGAGLQSINLELAAPGSREVVLNIALPPGKYALAASTATGTSATVTDGVLRFVGLMPGEYPIIASAGTCAPEMAGCSAAGTCPPGCSSLALDLVVPPGDGAFTFDVPLVEPVEIPKVVEPEKGSKLDRLLGGGNDKPPDKGPDKPPDPPPPPTEVEDPAAAKGGKAGKLVLQSEFAKWIAKNPEWQRDAAIAAGKADDAYLKDWKSGKPGTAGSPVVYVSWLAAQAYCASRGGLAAVDADPVKWTPSASLPAREWRQQGGKPAMRKSDGASSTSVKRTETSTITGFRCAK